MATSYKTYIKNNVNPEDYITYLPDTGEFIRNRTGNILQLTPFSTDPKGKEQRWYYQVHVCPRYQSRAHILAWRLHHGVWPEGQVDHINGNGLDNRIDNLRIVDNATNGKNCRRKCNNKSGVNGVYWRAGRNKWVAEIWVEGKKHFLGSFDNLEDAAQARHEANIEFGFHENHGNERINHD